MSNLTKIEIPIKEGQILYHLVSNNILKIKVSHIESNDAGIYVYGNKIVNDIESVEQYRFILITYTYGKTHFGKEVFVNEEDALNHKKIYNMIK